MQQLTGDRLHLQHDGERLEVRLTITLGAVHKTVQCINEMSTPLGTHAGP